MVDVDHGFRRTQWQDRSLNVEPRPDKSLFFSTKRNKQDGALNFYVCLGHDAGDFQYDSRAGSIVVGAGKQQAGLSSEVVTMCADHEDLFGLLRIGPWQEGENIHEEAFFWARLPLERANAA
jgi:hypothetical protein